ncbi:MAG TPA: cysteine hydrolase family protein [Pyrinomonadaceae bacterium]|nr:cysteine hydrolase family protein [Pyrinomonadaceae bacterium]
MSKETALVVIDVQHGVVDWRDPAARGEEVLGRIGELLARARAARAHVIYVQHEGEEGGRLSPGTRGWEIHAAVAPEAGEPVIHKRAADAFFETTLEEELRGRGVKRLVVVGCRTQYCVDTTCRRATTLGFDVTLASDAHTTAAEHLTAAQIVAHHNATLDDFGNDRHVVTVRASREIEF